MKSTGDLGRRKVGGRSVMEVSCTEHGLTIIVSSRRTSAFTINARSTTLSAQSGTTSQSPQPPTSTNACVERPPQPLEPDVCVRPSAARESALPPPHHAWRSTPSSPPQPLPWHMPFVDPLKCAASSPVCPESPSQRRDQFRRAIERTDAAKRTGQRREDGRCGQQEPNQNVA